RSSSSIVPERRVGRESIGAYPVRNELLVEPFKRPVLPAFLSVSLIPGELKKGTVLDFGISTRVPDLVKILEKKYRAAIGQKVTIVDTDRNDLIVQVGGTQLIIDWAFPGVLLTDENGRVFESGFGKDGGGSFDADYGQFDNESIAAGLGNDLEDPDHQKRLDTVKRLANMKKRRSGVAFWPLIRALDDSSPTVRRIAAKGLRKYRSVYAVGPLLKSLNRPAGDILDTDLYRAAQIAAAQSIGAIPHDAAVSGLIESFSNVHPDDVKIAIIEALVETSHPLAGAALMDFLYERGLSRDVLARIQDALYQIKPQANDLLKQTLSKDGGAVSGSTRSGKLEDRLRIYLVGKFLVDLAYYSFITDERREDIAVSNMLNDEYYMDKFYRRTIDDLRLNHGINIVNAQTQTGHWKLRTDQQDTIIVAFDFFDPEQISVEVMEAGAAEEAGQQPSDSRDGGNTAKDRASKVKGIIDRATDRMKGVQPDLWYPEAVIRMYAESLFRHLTNLGGAYVPALKRELAERKKSAKAAEKVPYYQQRVIETIEDAIEYLEPSFVMPAIKDMRTALGNGAWGRARNIAVTYGQKQEERFLKINRSFVKVKDLSTKEAVAALRSGDFVHNIVDGYSWDYASLIVLGDEEYGRRMEKACTDLEAGRIKAVLYEKKYQAWHEKIVLYETPMALIEMAVKKPRPVRAPSRLDGGTKLHGIFSNFGLGSNPEFLSEIRQFALNHIKGENKRLSLNVRKLPVHYFYALEDDAALKDIVKLDARAIAENKFAGDEEKIAQEIRVIDEIQSLAQDCLKLLAAGNKYDMTRYRDDLLVNNFNKRALNEHLTDAWRVEYDGKDLGKYMEDNIIKKKIGDLMCAYNKPRASKSSTPAGQNQLIPSDDPWMGHNFARVDSLRALDPFLRGQKVAGIPVEVFTQEKPLDELHSVILVDMQEFKKQVLDERAARVALTLMKASVSDEHAIMGFNSWGAWGSINHQHLQIFFYTDENRKPRAMPIEGAVKIPFLLSQDIGLPVTVYTLKDYPVEGFVVKGTDVASMASVITRMTDVFTKDTEIVGKGGIPFSIIFTKNKNNDLVAYVIPKGKYNPESETGTGVAFYETGGEILFIKENMEDVVENRAGEIVNVKGYFNADPAELARLARQELQKTSLDKVQFNELAGSVEKALLTELSLHAKKDGGDIKDEIKKAKENLTILENLPRLDPRMVELHPDEAKKAIDVLISIGYKDRDENRALENAIQKIYIKVLNNQYAPYKSLIEASRRLGYIGYQGPELTALLKYSGSSYSSENMMVWYEAAKALFAGGNRSEEIYRTLLDVAINDVDGYIRDSAGAMFASPEGNSELALTILNGILESLRGKMPMGIFSQDLERIKSLIERFETDNKDGGNSSVQSLLIKVRALLARLTAVIDNKKPDTMGGIDLRALPVEAQPAGAVSVAVPGTSVPFVSANELEAQWQKIEEQMRSGPMPYDQLKAHAIGCCRNKDAAEQRKALAVWITGILKLEEEAAVPTAPELKEILVAIS
ncbi:MAG: hypothetical protein WC547_06350, partial [Candidatus Omnitrophota bacterium]